MVSTFRKCAYDLNPNFIEIFNKSTLPRIICQLNASIHLNYARHISIEIIDENVGAPTQEVVISTRYLAPGDYFFNWLDFFPSDGKFTLPPKCILNMRIEGNLGIAPGATQSTEEGFWFEREQVNLHLDFVEVPLPTNPADSGVGWRTDALISKDSEWLDATGFEMYSQATIDCWEIDSNNISSEKKLTVGNFTPQNRILFFVGSDENIGNDFFIDLIELSGDGFWGSLSYPAQGLMSGNSSSDSQLFLVSIDTSGVRGRDFKIDFSVRPNFGKCRVGKKFLVL